MRVILRHNRHDIHLRLHRQMECPLLKRQQSRLRRIAPRTLGENNHALLLLTHLIRSFIERLERRLPVRAVDKYASRRGHEPAQDGDVAERLLRGLAAVLWEHLAEEEDVELGLVVRDEDGGPGEEVLLSVNDLEARARSEAHGPPERTRGGPLYDVAVADETEDDGDDDSVRCAGNEAGV